MRKVKLCLAQEPAADKLLSENRLALVIGMVLDQQFPLERAFASPYELTKRMGKDIDAKTIARFDPDRLDDMFAKPPALHRYPRSMARRVQEVCEIVVDKHGGDIERVWSEAKSAADLMASLRELPGFGEQKAKIFIALLGKQLGVQPAGWREVSAPYGEEGSFRSAADIVDSATLLKVRAVKADIKAAAKAALKSPAATKSSVSVRRAPSKTTSKRAAKPASK